MYNRKWYGLWESSTCRLMEEIRGCELCWVWWKYWGRYNRICRMVGDLTVQRFAVTDFVYWGWLSWWYPRLMWWWWHVLRLHHIAATIKICAQMSADRLVLVEGIVCLNTKSTVSKQSRLVTTGDMLRHGVTALFAWNISHIVPFLCSLCPADARWWVDWV